jgi:hypothetical protein
MHLSVVLALLAGSVSSVVAAPAAESQAANTGLRLIKTSPEDPGQWVTEEQKIRDYKSKGTGFVDITDITDAEVLATLSAPNTQEEKALSAQAVTYPSSVSHKEEANPLLEKVSVTDPKTWLKSLTE